MEDTPITAEQQVQGERGIANQEEALNALAERMLTFEEMITELRDELDKEKNSNIRLARDNDALRSALNGPRKTAEPDKSLFDDIM